MNQREAFEAWYGENYSQYALKNWDGTCYSNLDTDLAWKSWQAALASQWQPIETAPKGVDILASRGFGKPPVVAGYFEETKEWLAFDDPFTPLRGLKFWQPLPPEPAK